MSKAGVKVVVPHPETGESIAVDTATVKDVAEDGEFFEHFD